MTEDTIAAISTATGEGAIAIVRVSGPRAFEIADAIFVSKRGRPSTFPTHTIHFGRIGTNGNSVDQVMLSVMRAPDTYSAEDVIEINCHGSPLVARSILALCLKHGARLAEPGEFTKRAFLNGRLDLTQAEAVMDLIHAQTSRAQTAAMHALDRHLARKLEQLRDRLVTITAHVEAYIDFPEEDIDTGTRDQWHTGINEVRAALRQLLSTAAEGKILRQGLAITIIGRPNAGKSSLMNALLGEDRAIVTPVPGTTRDTIEESANIRGIPVRLTDTAGIRKARGKIEAIGIDRTHRSIESSDIVIHAIDGSRCTGNLDLPATIQVVTKSDLPLKIKIPAAAIQVSVVTGQGLEELKDRIQSLAGITLQSEMEGYVNERQAGVIQRAIDSLTVADEPEVLAQNLRIALNAIGEITGKTATEDILDKIFSTFCIGK